MEIEFKSAYFEDTEAKSAFERYAMAVFDLDFGRWKEKGLWDPAYVAFSAFNAGDCIASICVYPSIMSIDGQTKKGAQLLTVGTLPEYRRRGIQRELWERARIWIHRAACDFTFLFTDDSAAEFYEKLGFRRQLEFTGIFPFPPVGTGEIRFRKLDMDQPGDYAVAERLAHSREMISQRIGFLNPNLLLFMFLYEFRDNLYYFEECDCIVAASVAGNRLRLYDIVSPVMPSFQKLTPFLAHFGVEEVECFFSTDRLAVEPDNQRELEDSLCFVSDDFLLEGKTIFPASICV
jgi:GNAT superfamily N-acetyltransferase